MGCDLRVSDLGAWFTARYDSECASCGDEIEEGDRGRYVNDEVVCEDCGVAAEDD